MHTPFLDRDANELAATQLVFVLNIALQCPSSPSPGISRRVELAISIVASIPSFMTSPDLLYGTPGKTTSRQGSVGECNKPYLSN